MIKRIIYIFVFVFSCSVFGQNYVKHTVAVGETMTQIAKKYKVSTLAIYELNPDAKKGIQLNSILLIPVANSTKTKTPTVEKPNPVVAKPPIVKPIVPQTKPILPEKPVINTTSILHTVITKETLYSIAAQYNVSIESIQKANLETLKDGLKIGQQIVIPTQQKLPIPKIEKLDTSIYHEVVAKETKYAIANKYGITVEQLEKWNPEIVAGLNIGQKIIINGQAKNTTPIKELVKELTPYKSSITQENLPLSYINYEVKPKETLYSLSKMTGLTVDELTTLNPELQVGVKEGMIIKIPSTTVVIVKNEFADLSKSIIKLKRKKLVLLLPFNITKLENDTINSTSERLKKDKFLNMTLDFYSGALMAIDSAKTLGLNIDVKIFDSQETKNSSNVVNLIQQQKLENADAIIGPFYQDNVEILAKLLNNKRTAVISPLSKDTVESSPNLYQSMPSNEMVNNIMFDYLRSKDGNIIAVLGSKKNTIREYLIAQQKDVKITELDANGLLVLENFKKLFVKDKMNYVVMDSQKTTMIMAITNTMLSMIHEYQVQLVILEPNATLDFEEIDLERLTKLKLMYPSLTRENETPEGEKFRNDYREKNKILPNQYATRGFDVTFDTLLRLSQEKEFGQISSIATEQIENKFDYAVKSAQGFVNKGIYILYYDTDLTVKMAE